MNRSLREARKARGWTQAEAAEQAGISRQHYSQIEEGSKRPSLGVALAIAFAFGRSMDDLFHAPHPTAAPVPADAAVRATHGDVPA